MSSLYNHQVPFTSNLNMWSPSPSIITLSYNTTTTIPTTNFNYHHEPMYYPSACIICGLPHHPVPHTLMKDHDSIIVITAITTPAPSESVMPTSPKAIRKTTRNKRRFTARQQQSQQKYSSRTYKKLVLSIRLVIRKFIRIISVVLKAPSIFRRHNIYPIIKREDSNKLD